MISVLSDIDVAVEPRDIEACHSIGKQKLKQRRQQTVTGKNAKRF